MRSARYRNANEKKEQVVHPIWRGIGCILFLITPFISFAIANQIVLSGFLQQYIRFPRNLMQAWTIPGINYAVDAFLGTLIVTFAVMFLFFAAYFSIYAGMYRLMGPSKYGPTDVAPIRSKRKVKKSR